MIYTNPSYTKRRKSKSKKLQKANEEQEAWLRKMGFDPSKRTKPKATPLTDAFRKKREEKVVESKVTYSDSVPGNGNKKDTIKYTGNELAGVALMHKQAYEPIRKDNKEAAIASSQMRRN